MIASYRLPFAAISAAVVLASVVACSSNGGGSVNESLTSDDARDRTTEYFEQSLAALPPGARLDRVHPDLPSSGVGFGGFKPCYDSNTITDGPQYFGASYWVVDGGDGRAGLKALVTRWNEWGWTVEDATVDGGNSARGASSDDYRLTVKTSTNGFLSLSGSSPCFPFENGTDLDAQAPGTIEQR